MKILKFIYKHKRIAIYLLCAFLVVIRLLTNKKEEVEIIYGDGTAEQAYTEYLEEQEKENNAEDLNNIDSGNSETEDEHQGQINLNTATSEELQTVKGIGPVMASKILKYREDYGDFTCVDELIEVNGIGEKTLEKFRPYFFVE